VANLPVSLVEVSGIAKLQNLHNSRQRRLADFQKEVEVGFHQSVGIEMKGMSIFVFKEVRKVGSKVPFIQEYGLSLVSPRNYMIKSGRKMDSRFSRHRPYLPFSFNPSIPDYRCLTPTQLHPKKVYAGKDMVARDALCCDLLNVPPRTVLHIQLANESGMGKMNLAAGAGAIKHLRL
jgi:hypothetical protein